MSNSKKKRLAINGMFFMIGVIFLFIKPEEFNIGIGLITVSVFNIFMD